MQTRRVITGLVAAVVLAAGVIGSAQTSSPVADAARRGDLATVRSLLKNGADANAPQADGMAPLHWAAERGDAELAAALLHAGATTGAVTRIGQYSPLHLAARNGRDAVVLALLKAGAPVGDTTASGATALHLAANSGSSRAITALLDGGADINAREREYGQTPLVFATAQGHLDAVKTLIARGADIDAATNVISLTQQQAIDRQSATLRRQVLAAMVPPGAQPTASQQQAAVQAAREFYVTGKLPAPPAAAGAGRAGAPGAAPSPAADAGRATGAGAAGQASATDLQNAEGPAVAGSTKGGMTPLHHGARIGFTAAIPVLLDAGAAIDKKSADGNTPLLTALINGQFDVAMLLVEKGANPNLAAESYGLTPLWSVVNARWQPRTRYPQPQEMDYQKATYLDVMKALLEAGADPNARVTGHPWFMVYSDCGNANCGLSSVTGSTAFWRAAYGTDVDAMKLLVQYGADPNISTMAAVAARGGGGGSRAADAGGRSAGPGGPAAPPRDPSGLPPVPAGGPGVYPLHAAAGSEYGEGFAGNAHRHAPESWLAAVKYLVEETGADVNGRDDGGYTPLHHAAARGDNEVILYLVSKGADVKAVSRRGQTTADMANGPVSRISPYPETIALLVKLGAINNNKCASCAP